MLPNMNENKNHSNDDNDDDDGDEVETHSIYSWKLLRKHHAHTDDQWNSKIPFSKQIKHCNLQKQLKTLVRHSSQIYLGKSWVYH